MRSTRFGTEGSVVQIHLPHQIFKNPQETGRVKSRRSLGIAAQIPTLEPSARRFKLRISPKSSRSRQTRSHPSFLAGKHGLKPLGSLLASVTCVLRWTRTSTRYREQACCGTRREIGFDFCDPHESRGSSRDERRGRRHDESKTR
jgi:hypothetical protein